MSMHTLRSKMVKQFNDSMKTPDKPAAAPIVSKAEQLFQKAQAIFDTAGRKFHQDATPHLKASKAALAKAQATFNRAYRAHEKAGG